MCRTAIATLCLCSVAHAQNLLTGDAGSWSAAVPVWAVDGSTQYAGAATLKYKNADPNQYVLAVRQLTAKPLTAYTFTAMVKTSGIAGPDASGATIALEWRDSAGKFLGGFYPKGVFGTADWTKVGGTTSLSPANVAKLTAVCYARKGCTGSAWFAGWDLREAPPEPWSVTLLDPPFRGAIDDVKTIRFDVRLPANAALTGTVQCKLGDVCETHPANMTKLSLSLAVRGVHIGKNPFMVEWRDANGALLGSHSEPLTYKEGKSRAMGFKGGALLLGGRPFFPIGIYDSQGWVAGQTPARLQEIAACGFNCVLPYGILTGTVADVRQYLDAAQAAGLKVIFSLKDLYEWSAYKPAEFDRWTTLPGILCGVVTTFRTHPALLAWYVNDEGGPEKYDSLKANYDTVTLLDPDHPCIAVSNQPESLYHFVRTTDVMGVDPYPVPGSPLTLVSDWVIKAEATNRPVWSAIQVFNKSDYQPGTTFRGPSAEEMRAMTFLAVAAGADGLLMYSYYNLKQHTDFAQNWAALGGICRDLGLFTSATASGVASQPATIGATSRAWRVGGRVFLLIVNAQETETDCSVALPSGFAAPRALFGGGSLTQVSTFLRGNLPPFAVYAYVLEKK